MSLSWQGELGNPYGFLSSADPILAPHQTRESHWRAARLFCEYRPRGLLRKPMSGRARVMQYVVAAPDSKSLERLRRFDARNGIGDRFRICLFYWTGILRWLCSFEHETEAATIFQQSQTAPPTASVGAKSMAQTTNHLRDLLEKIKGDAQRALALLPSETELRSLGWKCTACGHVKHFTRPVTAAVADHCPKCKGDSFQLQ